MMCIVFINATYAQITVSGKITDANDGSPLPGVNVVVPGTTTGTVTDFDGNYTINVPSKDTQLMFSFIGYENTTITVGDRTTINVKLATSAQQLEDVVVTAFGIKKEKKALGYSVTEVKNDELTKAKSSNVINTISNKVAGVQISKTAGGAGGSSRIIIRGNSSLTGNNQPLIVVDGIPIDNGTNAAADYYGGYDYGDGIGDINPEDIESMSVLKGPNAAALYGSRAANGVILITTKKGRKRKGIGVSFTSNTALEFYNPVAKFQNKYGIGSNGTLTKYELTEEERLLYPGYDSLYMSNQQKTGSQQSWGPKMDGSITNYLNWNGEVMPLEAHPDNVKNFYETGYTFTNTLSLNGGNETATFLLTYTNMYNDAIIPNSTYQRNSITFRGSLNLTDRISADAKITYLVNDAYNRVPQGYTWGSPTLTFFFMPRNIDTDILERDYKNEYGEEQNYISDNSMRTNPYWELYENFNDDRKERVLGHFSMNFKLTSWLNFKVKAGKDFYDHNMRNRIASYSIKAPQGYYMERDIANSGFYTDFLLSADKKINDIWAVQANFGGSRNDRNSYSVSNTINGLAIPNFFSLNNYANKMDTHTGSYKSRKVVNSLFGSGQIAYRNYLFLELTARNDWSSTLPIENCSYFYPSVSLSWAITDAIDINPNILTFAKTRLSWARVGNDTSPYALNLTYGLGNYGETSTGFISGTRLPLIDLKPEITESIELGADLRFMNNRLGLDLTLYKGNSYNQIINLDVSKASGFVDAKFNAGEIENKGIELQLTVSPFKKDYLTWDISFNFAKNISKVVELNEGVDFIQLGSIGSTGRITARPGEAYGNIEGSYIKRYYKYNDDSTQIIDHPMNGKPLINQFTGEYDDGEGLKVIGNVTPDWMGGVINTFNYKGLSFGFTIGVQMGGDVTSHTNKYGNDNGVLEESLEGRESWYNATSEERAAGKSADGKPIGYFPEGVFADGTPNDRGLDPQVYWHQAKYGGIEEMTIYETSYVKLRELMIGYNLPQSIINKTPFTRAGISISARDLWIIWSAIPNVDPECAYTNQTHGLGQELFAQPNPRSISFNINLDF